MNGPEDDLLDAEWIVGPHATGPRGLARAGCRQTGKSGSYGARAQQWAWPTDRSVSTSRRRRGPRVGMSPLCAHLRFDPVRVVRVAASA